MSAPRPRRRPRVPLARNAAVALAAVLAAAPCRAADDGGTRSVFATGAGNRALALGGAFGAIANDASAALWNPGGLGFVSQGEVQISQADLGVAGFRETFVACVLPDWRWGVASLSLRTFGTSGIETRDDRNVLLESDASANDTEIGIAYGRRLGAAWSLGAAAKLRRQQIAGTSGGGLGADLGFQVLPAVALGLDRPWAQELRMGFALVNAIEPAIRLDRESVPDPSAYRLGFAWQRPAFFQGALLASFDVEKSRTTGARTHAGLELRLHPMLVVRTGLDDGAMTAGTGLSWGRAALEYAFADDPLGSSQRVGVAYRFGPTTTDASEAARLEEEARIERRLAELDQARQAARLADLVERADAARRDARFDEAIELLATVRTLDPAGARGRALERATLAEKARSLEAAGDVASAVLAYQRALAEAPDDTALAHGLERVRAEGDRRAARSADLRRRFAAALGAFGADDLPTARAELQAVIATSPDDAEARNLLDRVEQTIVRRADAWVQQALLLIQAGALRDADALLDRARTQNPASAGLAYAQGQLRKRQQAAQSADVSAPARPQPTPQLTRGQQRQLADFYHRGQAALEAGRSDEALRYWELVWAIQPGYMKVDTYLKREYLTRGMERFAAGDLDEAVGLWERALRIDPKDERTLSYLARAQEQRARARQIGGQE